jgi:nicotinate-nucleotide pyrophosphorylase (carboxylating)
MFPASEKTPGGGLSQEEREEASVLIRRALLEDLPRGDLTSRILFSEAPSSFPSGAPRTDPEVTMGFVARAAGILCGLPVVEMLAAAVDPRLRLEPRAHDGEPLEAGKPFLEATGPASALLPCERIALNFLQRLSGIASTTARWVAAIEGFPVVLLDTRKTTPGWRRLEKYAVRCGGATNHRQNLSEAILLKDNHAWILRQGGSSIEDWVAVLRAEAPGAFLEVEAATRDEFLAARRAGADAVLLDNFACDDLRWAVAVNRALEGPRPLLEASGGITLERLREVAACGVDRISAGALTHSAPALDISLEPITMAG